MRYIVTTPWWLRALFPSNLTWSFPEEKQAVYLTFDDGPHPAVTPFVLDQLKKYNAKATFFCIGKNVAAYPEVYKQVLLEGHRVGNHTHNHLNGKKTNDEHWLKDVSEAAQWIDSDLFRPPYGRINSFQAQLLQKAKRPYQIIMWNVLSGDFDTNSSPAECTHNVLKNAKAGSVIVFHDSEKAWPRLENALPVVLDKLAAKGFVFKAIG